MDPNVLNLIQGAAGAGGDDPVYVEDVFSTDLWNGNYDTTPAPININNGIDLTEEGGLVWTKNRNYANHHQLYDTERGAGSPLYSSLNNGEGSNPVFDSFNSNGFSLTAGTWGTDPLNGDSDHTWAAWTFRKAPGFFDVVEWTGNSTAGREISHNLGSVPGMIFVKCVSNGGHWAVYHKDLTSADYLLRLNDDNAQWSDSTMWDSTAPTSTVFTVGSDPDVNYTNYTYVAYLFAHDDEQFGDDGDEAIIKCGIFTGNTTVNLGFEPQWILLKSTSTGHWDIHDSMRGWPSSGDAKRLRPNLSDVEGATSQIYPNATGFSTLIGSDTYIYMAIRRGLMKTPEDATKVFSANYDTANAPWFNNSNFPVDVSIHKLHGSSENWYQGSRLQGTYGLRPSTASDQEADISNHWQWDYMDGWNNYTSVLGYISYQFRRASGFFDVVFYEGTGSARTVAHNLGVVPEMMIVKKRAGGSGDHWHVYAESEGNGKYAKMNEDGALVSSITVWDETSPTSTVFTVGTNSGVNYSGWTYIALLFASCPDVSKVGSYTGTGNDINIDCGFTAGARFVMIKRTDATGDWYVWDTERGIIAGDDPYLLMNEPDAEVTNTDYIDPLTTGFTVTSSAPDALNVSSGEYIYLAIA